MKATRLFALCAALALCACAKEPAAQAQPETEPVDQPKTLVAFFSATGTTKGVAERLAGAIGAELYEIAPETPYSMADLDWRDKTSRSSVEMADRASRPAIAGIVPDLSGVEVVFIGFPIWWYREPSIIDTFVEANADALARKTVVPFATSGGSGMGDSSANLQALVPAAKVAEGRRFRASASVDELAIWARGFR